MSRIISSLAALVLLVGCLAPVPASAAGAAPADRPRPLAKLAGPTGTAVEFSRDGKFILTAGGDEARVWDAATLQPVTPPIKHGPTISCARLSGDASLVLTAVNNEVDVWGARDGARHRILRHPSPVRSAEFSPEGVAVLTACGDTSARVWAAGSGAQLLALRHPAPVVFAQWSADGSNILTVARGAAVDESGYFRAAAYIWDSTTGRQIRRTWVDDWPNDGEEPGVRPVAISGDGRRLAVIRFKHVQVYDVASGEVVSAPETWERSPVCPVGVALDRDGSLLAAYAAFGANVWDARKHDHFLGIVAEEIVEPTAVRDVQFGPGRHLLVSRGADGMSLWNVASMQSVFAIKPAREAGNNTAAAGFSPDGRRVAAGFASDGYTAVWEVPEGKGP